MTQNQSLLTRKEAANYLGISLRTLDALLADGELPHIKIKRTVRIRQQSLNDFIEKHEVRRGSR